jgi:hypothetical protein
MRLIAVLAVLGAAACLPLACHLISGVGDLQFVDTGPGTGGVGAWGMGGSGGHGHTTTTSSSTSDGGGGGGAVGGSGGATGGQGGTPGPGPPCTELQDAFDGDALNYGLWSESYSSATGGVTGGYFWVAPAALTASARGSIRSVSVYDMQACAVLIELPQATNNEGDTRTSFTMMSESSYDDSFGFRITGGNLVSRVTVAGTPTEYPIPYDSGQHRWLQLREDAGTIYYETSPDGQNWTGQYETATPSFINRAVVSLSAGSTDGLSTNPGEARFDNVNLPP